MLKNEARDKKIFIALLILSFLMVFVFNYMTPMMTDDFSYGVQARQANGFSDLLRQEYQQYMTWNGRSVVHLILRCFLAMPVMIFNICNSAAFIVLSLCMYSLLTVRRRFDWFLYLCIQLGLWLYSVDFEQTILWETGACNYLWGSMIIMLFITAVHRISQNSERKGAGTAVLAAAMFLFGIIAGWCNENTSGGALLYVLLCMLMLLTGGAASKSAAKGRLGILAAAAAGNLAGLMLMIMSPGSHARAAFSEELHTGLVGLLSRFLGITDNVDKYFFTLLSAAAVLTILTLLQIRREEKTGSEVYLKAFLRPALFFFLFLATSYALILTAATQARAFFGAGIFLMLCVLELASGCLQRHEAGDSARLVIYSAASILTISFLFTYLQCGAQLIRIHRDCNERIAYILEQKNAGMDDITVAQVHPAFYNSFSAIDEMELEEDPSFWTNVAMEEYYGVSAIRAVPYDEWAVSVGRMTQEEAEGAERVRQKEEEQIQNALRKQYGTSGY